MNPSCEAAWRRPERRRRKHRRAAAGVALYGALGIGLDDRDKRAACDAESLSFYGAPHVAMLFAPDTAEARLAADVGMYGQTLLLVQARGVLRKELLALLRSRRHRAVATRYGKRDYMFRGTIDVASIRIWLRDPVP